MAPNIRVPANFGREHINSPVHGNLLLNLRDGRKIKTNSMIMSLNSPVINRLTSELHQSSLEMDDFSVGAVDCFVDSLYTGEIENLHTQIFEEVSKMGHAFEVTWLSKKCLKFYKSEVLNFKKNSYQEVLFACEIASRARYKQSRYVSCFVKNMVSRDISKTMFLQRYMADFAELSQRQLEMSLSVATNDFSLIMRPLTSHLTMNLKCRNLDKNSMFLLEQCDVQKFRLNHPENFEDTANLLLEISEVSESEEVKEVVKKFVEHNNNTETNVDDAVETTEECDDDDESDEDDDFTGISTQTDVELERGWIQAVDDNTYRLLPDNSVQLITIDNELKKSIVVEYNFVSEGGGRVQREFGMRCENITSSQWSYYILGCTVLGYNVQFLNNVPPDKVKHWIITKTSTHLNIVCNKVTVLNFNFATDSHPNKTNGKDIWCREVEFVRIILTIKMLLLLQ